MPEDRDKPFWLYGIDEPEKSEPMSADRLRWCLTVLGWSGQELFHRTKLNERNVRRALSGAFEVPAQIGTWLETLVAAILACPHEPEGQERLRRAEHDDAA